MEAHCHKHKREIAWFCSDCSVAICTRCMVEHKHHNYTETEACEKVAADITAAIATQLSEAASAVEAFQAQIDQHKSLQRAIDSICRLDFLAAEECQASQMRALQQRFESARFSAAKMSEAALSYLSRAREVTLAADKENEVAVMKIRAALATFAKVKNVKERLQKGLALSSLPHVCNLPAVPPMSLERPKLVPEASEENWSVEERRTLEKLA